MAGGEVQTVGSTLFLKQRFGAGYNLILSKTDGSSKDQIDGFIKNSMPEAVLMQDLSTEFHYQIPGHASSKFKDFFNRLDGNLT